MREQLISRVKSFGIANGNFLEIYLVEKHIVEDLE